VSPDALREAIAARACRARQGTGPVDQVARRVAALGGSSVRALVFFGSRKTRASPGAHSAYDLFVLTGDYASFYGSLRAAGMLRRSPSLVGALNVVLPPNQISLRGLDETGTPWHAKCAVISQRAFRRETSARRRDHFCLGRLCQPVALLYAADADAERAVLDGLASCHRLTLAWARPWLPERFDVEGYCRTMLSVSLAQEIRPEPEGRAAALFDAQRDDLLAVYAVLLEELAAAGRLRSLGGGQYALARQAGLLERLRVRIYFAWSLLRATARWAKYVVTFDDWLDYIVRKAERHSGQAIVLDARERRFPLLFLWPRLFRYLRGKDRNREGS
jgi:hypothetical protein